MLYKIIIFQAFLLFPISLFAQNTVEELYYRNGRLNAIGSTNELGKREGLWKFYGINDTIKTISKKPITLQGSYKQGVEIGEWHYFFSQGFIVSKLLRYNENNTEDYKFYSYETFTREGKLEESGTIKANQQEGSFYRYHNNGTIYWEGKYENNLREGNWKIYSNDGTLKSETEFEKGTPNGVYVSYWSKDKIERQGVYIDGAKTGSWKNYYRSGNIEKEETFNGDSSYNEVIYYDKGTLKQVSTIKDYRNIGKKTSYYDTGKVKVEKNYNEEGKLDGLMRSYKPDGTVAKEINYEDGKVIENNVIYNNNGTPSRSCVESKGITECTDFFENSKTPFLTTRYKGQKLLGSLKYFENGKLDRECELNSDNVNVCTTYNQNGFKTSTVSHKKGKQFGTWIYYNSEGEVSRTVDKTKQK